MKTPDYTYFAYVSDVYDGDSITVDIDLGLNTWSMGQKLRLYGINTPEVRGPDKERGLMVRDYVRHELLFVAQGKVLIRTHKDRKGKYGRWLATVFYSDNYERNLNEELVQLGYAGPYLG